MDQEVVRILVVEDNPADAELVQRALVQGGVHAIFHRVEDEASMRAALAAHSWDLALLDYSLPTLDAPAALAILKRVSQDIPAIVVSGSVGEEVAVATMRAGATDFVMKDNLTRLVPAVRREIHDSRIRRNAARTEAELSLVSKAVDAASIGIIIGDARQAGHPIIRVNDAFTRITGYLPEDVMGRSCNILQGPETSPETVAAMREALAVGRQFSGVVRNYRKDGTPFWNQLTMSPVYGDDGVVSHVIGMQVDVTAQVDAERELEWVTNHDTLTGLPNRNGLVAELEPRLRGAAAADRVVTVLALDIVRFGQLNDSLGRATGDLILGEVAERLQSLMPAGSSLARTGPDEFVLACTLADGRDAPQALAQRVHARLSEPYAVEQLAEPLVLTVNSGLAVADKADKRAERVLGQAEVALADSRQAGRNEYRFYSPDMTAGATRTLSLEGALRAAISTGQLTLHYQPQVNLRDGSIAAVEALVRWRHPDHGLVSPADFIPLAEETGLIIPLGEWVLGEALRQAAEWQSKGIGPLRVAVNLSVQQLQQGYIEQLVRALLDETGVPATLLELEITESQLIHNFESKQRLLAALDDYGVLVAIDDFGTGYSSLAYLTRLAVDTLKVDRSFVKDAGKDRDSANVVAAISSLAHSLGMTVVAEGVETEAQEQMLRALDCDIAQGYLYCKPVPPDELARFMAGRRAT